MLVLETQAVKLEGWATVSFEFGDHRLAAARITAHRIDGDRIVGRHETGIDEGPDQRHRTRGVAARIRDFPRGSDLADLIRCKLGKAVSPIERDTVRR